MSVLRHHRHLPRVTLVWAALTAALLVWHPHLAVLTHFASTSLHNLADHPVAAIGLSLVLVSHGWGEWWTWVGLSVVWVVVERSLGWRRSLTTFLSGHILATVGVALAQAAALLTHVAGTSISRADDVGASYGFLALGAAGLAHGVGRDRRWLAAAPLLVLLSVIEVDAWTIGGHALAITVGLTVALVVVPRRLRAVALPAS